MSIITIIAVGIVAGLLYIYKSIKQAGDDPENFDHYKNDPKFRKPDGWKTGKFPSTLEKKPENMKQNNRFDFSLFPISYN